MSYPSNKFGAVDAGGAFVIGGGDFNFGQEYTEQIIRGMFKVPAPSLANGLSLLREYLLKMPLEVLETFKPLLPDVVEGAFDTVAGAVDAIMDGLTDVVQFLRLDKWQEFLDKITDGVESTVEDAVEAILSAGEWFRHMIDQLLTALGITPTGTLQDRLFDLSDELEAIQSAAAQAWDDVTDLAQDLLTNPAAVLGTIPKSVVSGLSQMETVLNQITEILAGNVVTPVNSLAQAVKDWFNQWFGGGSASAIPLSQKGAANGVAPLNSSTKIATSYLETDVPNGVPKLNGSGKVPTSSLVTNTAGGVPILDGSGKVGGAQMPDLSSTYMPLGWKGAPDGVAPLNSEAVVPLANLPAEIGGEGGTGAGRPYVMLILQNNVTIPNSGITPLSGWVQTGSASVTFEDGSNTRWRFSLRGLWQIEFSVSWDGDTTGARTVGLRREVVIDYPPPTGTQQGMLELISESRAANSLYGSNVQGLGTMHRAGTVRVSDWDYENTVANYVVHFTEDDWFDICAYQNTGSNRAVEGFGRPWAGWAQSIVTCTYLGAA
ncbi:minor tail protein [Mycobacterium phage Sham4]|nr:minor tail protein [Mycobacterium phage Bud]UOW92677.1 minor tail protein [Mycobacterium phage Sham4]